MSPTEAASDVLQPMRDRDTTIEDRPEDDPAQVEWDRTTPADAGEKTDADATATGDDPAQIPDDLEDFARDDLAPDAVQPESQGEDWSTPRARDPRRRACSRRPATTGAGPP